MPHVGVYLGGIDVHVVHAHVVEDDIYRVHPRYRRQYGKSRISVAESRWGRQQITCYPILGRSSDRNDVRAYIAHQQNYGATGMIRSWAFRMTFFSVPFLVAFHVPHVPMMRTTWSVCLITYLEMRDSVHAMWLDGAESMYTVVSPTTCEFNVSA